MHRLPFRIFLKPLTEAFSEPCQITNMERFAKIVQTKRCQGDSLSTSFLSCIKLLNAPFCSCLPNSSRTHFFLFLSSFFFILNKTASCKNKISSSSESGMISKEFHNSGFIFSSEDLMTAVSRIIVKYRRKIIAKYRQLSSFIAYWEPSFRGGSRAAAISKMEHFVIIVNSWKPSWMLQ